MSACYTTRQACLPSTRVTTTHRLGERRKQEFSYKWLESTQTWRHKTGGVTRKTPPRTTLGMKKSPERLHLITPKSSHHKKNVIPRSKHNFTKHTRRWSTTPKTDPQSESFQEALRKHYEDSRIDSTRIQSVPVNDTKNDVTLQNLEVSNKITT